VGALVMHDHKILLVMRKNPPAQGQWAIPGGRIKWGETLQEAAEREIFEETGIIIRANEPVYTFDTIVRDHNNAIVYHYVIVDLAADFVGGTLSPGDDAVKAAWLSAHELKQLHVNTTTLKLLTQINFLPNFVKQL
jgi:ADP-ribose pyrophosphatase